MKYYIEIGTINKAKEDIDEICRREGFVNLTRKNFGSGGVGRFMTKMVSVCRILTTLHKGDILFLQYPMKKFYKMACTFAQCKGAKVVTIIHDLGAFRRHKLTPEQENRRLAKTDFLIVHNPTMRDYLLEHGFKGGIHCLQIFDYLSDKMASTYTKDTDTWQVVYAGNLGKWRNEFLYKLDQCIDGWEMDLYGKGFEESENHCDRLHYHGFIASDDFISNVKADFGLVWDGDSIDACTGAWGEYLKINNPHKTSFYLRAGIPVIVWSQAAMAPFVRDNHLGLVVDTIEDIGRQLRTLTTDQYQQIRENAAAIALRLADGHYVKEGMRAADKYLQ